MVLVSVVGDFDSGLLPVFYYHVESLKVHILLHDRKDAAKARRLQEGMKRFCAHLLRQLSRRVISRACTIRRECAMEVRGAWAAASALNLLEKDAIISLQNSAPVRN